MTTIQQISIYVMVFFYGSAGINHFINPKFYIGIMPKFLPMQNLLNQASGIAEIILAIGLLLPATRQISAYLIIALLISFFIVHIGHLFQPPKGAEGYKYIFLVIRFFLQFVLIYWAWLVSKY